MHEKTALASVVLKKEEINNFTPKDASPFKIKIFNFYPNAREGEATALLDSALSWKKIQTGEEEQQIKRKLKKYEKLDITGVSENIFPQPIKKLLNGLTDGKKRGLFVLITFFRSLNFSPDYINKKIREWNKLNNPPLKEGYIKSQIEWHLRQKRTILPPNYNNDNFYKDLNLLDSYKPKAKNPIGEVLKIVRKKNN